MKKWFKLLRCKHYLKNVLIFLPIIFSGEIFNKIKLFYSLLGFISFCFIASSIYIINDICDIEKDKLHPVKCKRPLASGKIKKESAIVLSIVLVLISIFINIFIIKNIYALIFIIAYFVLNLAYSFGLKNTVILDIAILVSGFVIRVLYGGCITNIEISGWLFLTIMSLSFYMGLGKRRNEQKKHTTGETRKVLQYYNYDFLDKNMYMCMTLAIAFYSLWAMSLTNKYMLYTVPLVLLLCMRYSLDVEGNSDGDPIEVVLHDKMIILFGIIYSIIIFFILYGKTIF